MGLIRKGTRDELVEQLRDIASGCLGSDEMRQQAVEAAVALRKGASEVQVGHSSFSVKEK